MRALWSNFAGLKPASVWQAAQSSAGKRLLCTSVWQSMQRAYLSRTTVVGLTWQVWQATAACRPLSG